MPSTAIPWKTWGLTHSRGHEGGPPGALPSHARNRIPDRLLGRGRGRPDGLCPGRPERVGGGGPQGLSRGSPQGYLLAAVGGPRSSTVSDAPSSKHAQDRLAEVVVRVTANLGNRRSSLRVISGFRGVSSGFAGTCRPAVVSCRRHRRALISSNVLNVPIRHPVNVARCTNPPKQR
jgi:hypothetical protein